MKPRSIHGASAFELNLINCSALCTAERIPGGYVVKVSDRPVARLCVCAETKADVDTAKVLTMDEGQRVGKAILPNYRAVLSIVSRLCRKAADDPRIAWISTYTE